jgi:hypothetical protein
VTLISLGMATSPADANSFSIWLKGIHAIPDPPSPQPRPHDWEMRKPPAVPSLNFRDVDTPTAQ